ncbi:tyrosine-type recombinase/integrase [Azospirillum sp. sgz301742]
MLVDATGVPLFDPTVWSISSHRHKSAATMEQALRGAMLLHLFCLRRGIDLIERVRDGSFFDVGELDALAADAARPFANLSVQLPSQARVHRRSGGAAKVTRFLRRLPSVKQVPTVDPETTRIRLHYLKDYLKWLGTRQRLRLADGAPNSVAVAHGYGVQLDTVLEQIQERMPNPIDDRGRVSLTAEQLARLLEIAAPDSPSNPWKKPFVRLRNWLIIRWLLATGMRRGEFLGAWVRDFNRGRGYLEIRRRHDDKADPRVRQPNAKTLERFAPLNEEMVEIGERYLVARNSIIAARKHPFLLVSEDGNPLSLSSITEVFAVLREHLRQEFSDIELSAHVLRHQWNQDFSAYADGICLDEDDEVKERCWLMGWSLTSSMPTHYLKRRTKSMADEHSKAMQGGLMRHRQEILARLGKETANE